MTNDEMIELAKKAGVLLPTYQGHIEHMMRFAELVAAKERERCAKKCDDNASKLGAGLGNTALRVTAMDIRAGRV